MPLHRSGLILTCLALTAAAACSGNDATTVTITLRIDAEALRPEHAMLRWRVPGRPDRPEERLPEYGNLERQGSVLGSVTFEVDPSIAGERELTVTGYRQDRPVSRAEAKVSWTRGASQHVTLTLEKVDECTREPCTPLDPDSTPTALDSDGGVDAAPKPDATAAEVNRDVRSDRPSNETAATEVNKPDNAQAPDGPRADAPRDSAIDGDPPPVSADAAQVDLRPAEPPSGVELGRNLELYLRFDEGGLSQSAADGSGLGAAATLVNLDVSKAWIPGPQGNALAFPADTPGWIRVTSPTLNTLTETFTLSTWIRIPDGAAGGSARRTIIARRYVGPAGFLYSLHLIGDHPGLFINSTNGANANFTSTQSLPTNQWVHLALVYDRSFARLWMGGRNIGEASYQLAIPPENSPLCIGASEDAIPTSASDPLGADLDEVAVYDRALSADEIAALARGFQPPLR